jgi:tRNA G18 (ribose-2'-O)-methylase SpoU
LGVKKIYITGSSTIKDLNKIKKTAKDSDKYQEAEFVEDIYELIEKLRTDGYTVTALETAQPTKAIPNYMFRSKTALVLGNEEIGITEKTLKQADCFIEIPMLGFKNSLNVSVAASIAIYEYNRQIIYPELITEGK